jgi:hypothetical protein
MCDTINPVGNVYCQRCNARLVPLSPDADEEESEEKTRPIKGFSLPTIPLEETAGEEEKGALEETEQEESPGEDWLNELRGSTGRRPEETRRDSQTEDDQEFLEPADIPDWLSELGPVGEEVPRSSGGETRPERADTSEQRSPSSLTEADEPEVDSPRSGEEAAPEPAEIPDWLRELGPVGEETPPLEDASLTMEEPASEEAEADQPLTEAPDVEETPKWLQDVLPSRASISGERESEAEETEPAVIKIPDWLEEAEAGAAPRPTAEPAGREEDLPAPSEPAEGEAETETTASREVPAESVRIPSWLREARGGQEEAPPEGPVAPFTEEPPESIETPEWLTELMTPASEEVVEGSPFPAELGITEEEWSAELERAHIPDWLQELRPRQDEGAEAMEGPLETEGLLRGLRGLIPASQAVSAPGTFEGPSRSPASEATLARAELLQSLLGQPAIQPTTKPRREEDERAIDAVGLAERWLVAGLLIVAVLGVLLAPLVTGQGVYLTQPVVGSGARDLHRAVNELDASDHVLVAFDYGPPEADELDAVAEPVLTHVLEQGAQVSIVSTRPDGPLIARAMMTRIADSEERYTLIGYRPGAATAVSQLLSATDGTPTLLMALTSRPTPLRLWIEQAYARYGDQLPIVAGGSAGLEPVASPYLDANAGQLKGAVHGLKGAAAYEAMRGTIGGATQRLDALAAGHIAIVLVMIVGALINAVGGAARERM